MDSTLIEQSQSLLDSYNPNNLNMYKLRDEFLERDSNERGNNEDDLFVDSSNVKHVEAEVVAFKEYFDRVKFSWQESNVKRRFVQQIFSANATPINEADIDKLDTQTKEKKSELNKYKSFAQQLRDEISSQATYLDKCNSTTNQSFEELKTLTRQVRNLENELSILKHNSSSAASGKPAITIAEADQILDDQVNQIHTLTDQIAKSSQAIQSTKMKYAQVKRDLEKANSDRTVAERARAEAEKSKSEISDKRIEKTCKSFQSTQMLLEKLLGIKKVERRAIVASSSNPTAVSELVITYDINDTDHHKNVQLCLVLDSSNELIGAHLADSDESIADIFEAHKHDQNVTALVLEVLERVGKPLN